MICTKLPHLYEARQAQQAEQAEDHHSLYNVAPAVIIGEEYQDDRLCMQHPFSI